MTVNRGRKASVADRKVLKELVRERPRRGCLSTQRLWETSMTFATSAIVSPANVTERQDCPLSDRSGSNRGPDEPNSHFRRTSPAGVRTNAFGSIVANRCHLERPRKNRNPVPCADRTEPVCRQVRCCFRGSGGCSHVKVRGSLTARRGTGVQDERSSRPGGRLRDGKGQVSRSQRPGHGQALTVRSRRAVPRRRGQTLRGQPRAYLAGRRRC